MFFITAICSVLFQQQRHRKWLTLTQLTLEKLHVYHGEHSAFKKTNINELTLVGLNTVHCLDCTEILVDHDHKAGDPVNSFSTLVMQRQLSHIILVLYVIWMACPMSDMDCLVETIPIEKSILCILDGPRKMRCIEQRPRAPANFEVHSIQSTSFSEDGVKA